MKFSDVQWDPVVSAVWDRWDRWEEGGGQKILLRQSTFSSQCQRWTIGINITPIKELVLLLKLFSHYRVSQQNLNKNHDKLKKGQWIRCKGYCGISCQATERLLKKLQ